MISRLIPISSFPSVSYHLNKNIGTDPSSDILTAKKAKAFKHYQGKSETNQAPRYGFSQHLIPHDMLYVAYIPTCIQDLRLMHRTGLRLINSY